MLSKVINITRQAKKEIKRPFCSAIIVSAGKGSRMNSKVNKQFLNILNKPLLAYTLEAFEACDCVDEIIVVTREEEIVLCTEMVDRYGFCKVSKVIQGGEERQDSVRRGINEVSGQAQVIAIHDGARPLVLPEHIKVCIKEASESFAAALGVKVKDTIKLVDKNLYITKTPEREKLWAVQTPQAFDAGLIFNAHKTAEEEGISATDDCALVEYIGARVKIIEGSYENIKVTTPEDIVIAEAILKYRQALSVLK